MDGTMEGLLGPGASLMPGLTLQAPQNPNPQSFPAGLKGNPSGCRVNLVTLPIELHHEIGKNLDGIWLIQLSYTCKALRNSFSFVNGNKVWYDIYPPALYQAREQYQWDLEVLWATLLKKQYSSMITTSELFPSRELIWPGNYVKFFPELREFDLYDPTSLATMSEILECAKYFVMPEAIRKPQALVHKQVVGGLYDPTFNYKRELLGHIAHKERCWICLTKRSGNGRDVHIRAWGMLLCSECVKQYSVSTFWVHNVSKQEDLLNYLVKPRLMIFPQQTAPWVFRPEVDCLLGQICGYDARTLQLRIERQQQLCRAMQLEVSYIEHPRRLVRKDIVAAAESLWRGTDPVPKLVISPDGETVPEPRKKFSNDRLFKIFRERFAPTEKLKFFLFPELHLSDNPSTFQHNPYERHLDDPTALFTAVEHFDRCTKSSVCNIAYIMLMKLINWRAPDYYEKDHGGYVTSWIKAAEDWHLSRMEESLETGRIWTMEHLSGQKDPAFSSSLLNLRAALGYPTMALGLPKRPERGVVFQKEDYDKFAYANKAADEAESKLTETRKRFNTIVRHSCRRCPETSFLFYPYGFKGLVSHMRKGHPATFFEGSFDTIN